MPDYTFVGPYGPIDMPTLGLTDVSVGQVVDIPSEHSAEFDARSDFESVQKPKSKPVTNEDKAGA